MTFMVDAATIAHVSIMPEVRAAAEEGARLIALWPLTDAKWLENDAKYAEDLQVGVTRTIAALLTGDDVTIPDAEFVYEGAEEIPGRPQRIVEALLAANNAYDIMSDYSETGDTSLVMAGAGELGVVWSSQTVEDIARALEVIEQLAGGSQSAPASITQDIEEVSQRFALVILALDGLLSILEKAADTTEGNDTDIVSLARNATPILPYINELCERVSIPRVFLRSEQFLTLLAAQYGKREQEESQENVVASGLASLAQVEWQKHYEAVQWDPEEAKKKAKEEDERKSKEALAAKFAHIKDDPTKETVEL